MTIATVQNETQFLTNLLYMPLDTVAPDTIQQTVDRFRQTLPTALRNMLAGLGANAIDLAGTGGSGITKFNTSTAAAFIIASAGVNVLKFGNRSITGTSGSMDFLSALGITRSLEADAIEKEINTTNLAFLNAAVCYPLLGSIREERKALNRPSIFNFVGPLLNPTRPSYRLMGVSDERIRNIVDQHLAQDGNIVRAITVRSEAGLDELVVGVTNHASLVHKGQVNDISNAVSHAMPGGTNRIVTPEGNTPVRTAPSRTLEGTTSVRMTARTTPDVRTPQENARAFIAIIDGTDSQSNDYKNLILNSAAGLLAADVVSSIEEGISEATKLLRSGSALRKFEQVRSRQS